MEEGLRLAYLAAMDIPVWLLRGSDPVPMPGEEQALPGDLPPARERVAAPLAEDRHRRAWRANCSARTTGRAPAVTRSRCPGSRRGAGGARRTASRRRSRSPACCWSRRDASLFIEATEPQCPAATGAPWGTDRRDRARPRRRVRDAAGAALRPAGARRAGRPRAGA